MGLWTTMHCPCGFNQDVAYGSGMRSVSGGTLGLIKEVYK
jgi:hypothetical protein